MFGNIDENGFFLPLRGELLRALLMALTQRFHVHVEPDRMLIRLFLPQNVASAADDERSRTAIL